MGRRLERRGAASIPSLTHAGFDAGAQMGISRPITTQDIGIRAQRVVRFKSRHDTYRRMLDHLGL